MDYREVVLVCLQKKRKIHYLYASVVILGLLSLVVVYSIGIHTYTPYIVVVCKRTCSDTHSFPTIQRFVFLIFTKQWPGCPRKDTAGTIDIVRVSSHLDVSLITPCRTPRVADQKVVNAFRIIVRRLGTVSHRQYTMVQAIATRRIRIDTLNMCKRARSSTDNINPSIHQLEHREW